MAGSIRRFRWLGAVWVAVLATVVSFLALASPAAAQADETEPTLASDDIYTASVGTYISISLDRNDQYSDRFESVEIIEGELPPGLRLEAPPTLVGTPVEVGVYESVYRITSSSGSTDTATIRIAVGPPEGSLSTVEGTLFYEDGTPAAGVEINAFRLERFNVETLVDTATVAADGSFRFDLIVDRYILQFEAFDDAVYRSVADQHYFYSPSADYGYERFVDLGAGVPVESIDLELARRSANIYGFVSGWPAEGLSISYYKMSPDGYQIYQRRGNISSSDGSFNDDVPPGDWVVRFFFTGPRDYVSGRWFDRSVTVGDGESVSLNVSLNDVVGSVVGQDGTATAGVVVDGFSLAADGSRQEWLGSERTGANGRFEYSVADGCYVFVFNAPDGTSFAGGSAYVERSQCVEGGETASIDISVGTADVTEPNPNTNNVVGSVVGQDGTNQAGVVVDRFSVVVDERLSIAPVGARQEWLDSATTGANGRFEFPVVDGCYIFVFIAPDGTSFADGSAYAERSQCVEGGETASIDVSMGTAVADGASISGEILDDYSRVGVSGVVVDWFRAGSDGSRAEWIGDVTSDVDGAYSFDVEPGCGVLVFIAPNGRTFTNGSMYFELPTCIKAGQQVPGLDALLAN